ncbi:MAG: hypothetical protein AAB225_13790 [Acidobacteriota bacterium]
MQNVSIRKAQELPANVKSAVERLLGRSVAPDEEVSIVAVPPQRVPPAEDRAQVARQLEALLNRRAKKVEDVSEEVIDAAIDEAVNHVRHSRS